MGRKVGCPFLPSKEFEAYYMWNIQQLIDIDKELLLTLNGSDSLFWDGAMWVLSDSKTWLLMGVVLLYIIFKNNVWKNALLIVCILALAVTLSDQFSSGLCKPLFMRYRPSQDPDLMTLVSLVNNYKGGSYGFISSHAANCFAIATFVALLLRNRWLTVMVYLWALLPSYSRAYLGVHYPGDLFCGAIAGCVISILLYWLYVWINKHYVYSSNNYVSSQYTCSGYMVKDIERFFTAMLITGFYVLIKALWLSKAFNF